MSAAERLAALDDLDPGELCRRTGAVLADFVEVMNAETTLLRAHRYKQAAELTAEKTQLAQDYVGLARAVQRRLPQLRAEVPDEIARLHHGHDSLATQMAEKGGVYVLDEPTSGLHLADVDQLLGLLDRLVESGKSVIVIEHHQAVMDHADWIIDVGPGAGHDGGKVVFEGTPADLVAAKATLTGQHLAAYVRA